MSLAYDPIELLALRLAAFKDTSKLVQLLLQGFGQGLSADLLMQNIAQQAFWPITQEHRLKARQQWSILQMFEVSLVPVWQLPKTLAQLPLPPVLLFVRGNVSLLADAAVAVVGSRKATQDAMEWAADYAYSIAQSGTLVVSGGALGIDAAAHAGALAAGGATLAYIGTPIDKVYPSRNKALFASMLKAGGAIVSEHPPLSVCQAWHHAARNRFIATHAKTLMIVEAAEGSGTLGTAQWAHRLGRIIEVSPPGVGGARDGIAGLIERGWVQEHAAANLL